jgi:PAS domain-containing protein
MYIGVYAMSRRQVKGGIHFGGLMLAAAFWSTASAHEMVAYGADVKVMFSQLSYLGIVFVGWLWLIFAMEYTQVQRTIIKIAKVALFPIPFFVLILVFGNDYFGAIWPRTYQLVLDGYAPVIYEHGWGFYLNTAVIYIEVLIGIGLMLGYGIKRYSKKDNGPLFMAIAIMITWVVNFLYVFTGTRYAGYDITPLVLGVTGIVIFYGVFRSRLFAQLPTAKDVAFHVIDSGMVIVNKDGVVLEINAMGRKLLHEDIKPGTVLTNTNFGTDKVLKHQVAVLLGKATENEFYCERLEKWIEVRSYEVGRDKKVNEGKLFFFYDITRQRELYDELHKSKEFFSSVIDFLPEPTFVVDASGNIIVWNKAIAEMTNTPAAKMIGKGDFTHAEVFYG